MESSANVLIDQSSVCKTLVMDLTGVGCAGRVLLLAIIGNGSLDIGLAVEMPTMARDLPLREAGKF